MKKKIILGKLFELSKSFDSTYLRLSKSQSLSQDLRPQPEGLNLSLGLLTREILRSGILWLPFLKHRNRYLQRSIQIFVLLCDNLSQLLLCFLFCISLLISYQLLWITLYQLLYYQAQLQLQLELSLALFLFYHSPTLPHPDNFNL